MRSKRNAAFVAAVLTASLATAGLALSAPAYADPTPSGTYRALVGVGSDTIQDVMNALAGDTVNGKSYAATAATADGDGIASYNAVDPTTGAAAGNIQTRANGPVFPRPNGSGQGQTALSDSLTNDSFQGGATAASAPIGGQVDFARSSSGPSVAGSALTYIPLARDAVSYVADGSELQSLTPSQLHDIYTGALTEINGVTLHPFIPQPGSGTRKFFEAAIGVTDATLGADVTNTYVVDGTTTLVEENQADDIIVNSGDLVPFSAGSWIAQNNGIAPDRSTTAAAAGAFIGSVQLTADAAGTYTSPVTSTDGVLAPNAAYYNDATFGRDVYNVVPTRELDSTSLFFNKAIYDLFATVGSHVAVLDSASAQTVISSFGFLNEAYDGSIDPSNHAKLGGLANSEPTTLPGTPGLTVTPGAGRLAVNWTAPANTGLAVSDYRVVVSGANGVVASQDVTGTVGSYAVNLPVGSYSVSVYADNLNGAGTPATWSGKITAGAPKAGKLTVAAPRTTFGTWEDVSATVTAAAGSPVPTGPVSLYSGSTLLARTALNAQGHVVLWFLSSHLAVGTHTLTVSYAGDAATLPVSAPVSVTVVKATPKLALSYAGTVSHTGHDVVTVTVSAPNATAGGSVRIFNGKTVIGTGTVVNGKVKVTLAALPKGRHSLWISYYGNTELNALGESFVVTAV